MPEDVRLKKGGTNRSRRRGKGGNGDRNPPYQARRTGIETSQTDSSRELNRHIAVAEKKEEKGRETVVPSPERY